jgi:hypothetical protein
VKFFSLLIILIFLQSCSFDNKSGIWIDNNTSDKDIDLFKDFKVLNTRNSNFDKVVPFEGNFTFKLNVPFNNSNWLDNYYDKTNNFTNFNYNGSNQLVFEGKKIIKSLNGNPIFLENNNLILSDQKGNVITYSNNLNTVKTKFNFYKKNYKKIEKNLNIIVEDGIAYISDNLGYLYALDYDQNNILWAKNFKVPFRSNLKISGEKIILSNQNNGNMIKLISTEESIVKNQFRNNLSLNKNSLFFLNTYGSLYSIDIETLNVKWFINLNQSLNLDSNNIFSGTPIINFDNKIAVSSNNSTYIIDATNGSVLNTFNFSSKIKPIIFENFYLALSKNDLLIAIDLENSAIIYSYDINEQISKFFDIKKKKAEFKNIFIGNDHIFIVLENSFYLKLSMNGDLKEILKFPRKISSELIIAEGKILFINSRGRLTIVN